MPANSISQSSRRSFLRGNVHSVPLPIRPPWTDEQLLVEACTRCDDCRAACPENVLVRGEGGYPAFDPKQGSGMCTFCGECVKACNHHLFDVTRTPAWSLNAHIDQTSCLAQSGIHCETCRDACDQSAIAKTHRIGLPPLLLIAAEMCTGCGACLPVCPADAVELVYGTDTKCAA